MSMILGLHTAANGTIDRVLATPALIWRILAPDDPEILASAMAESKPSGFFARLFGKKQTAPAVLPELTLSEEESSNTDLDKAWHGIHFLLTGSGEDGDPPLNFLLAGGVPVGDIEVGYGPARVFRSADVAKIVGALDGISEDELRKRFAPDVMTKLQIYPSIWERDPKDDDALGYLMEYFKVMKEFMADAAGKGLGVIVTLE